MVAKSTRKATDSKKSTTNVTSKVTKPTTPKKVKEVVLEEEEKEDDGFEAFPSDIESDESEDEEEEEKFDGFESTDDEADEEASNKTSNDITETEIKTKITKELSKSGKQNKEKPGVVYVGRIPHGFYEDQMRSYFGQFGTITRLRLSRNKKTGKSKHYAFVEFESGEVARIVSETMDNYLLFGHILKVKLIPTENVHEKLFVGANKTFKAVPWTKISKHRNDMKKTKEAWEELQKKEDERRVNKEKKLQELGINYKLSKEDKEKEDVEVKSKPKTKGKGKRKSKA